MGILALAVCAYVGARSLTSDAPVEPVVAAETTSSVSVTVISTAQSAATEVSAPTTAAPSTVTSVVTVTVDQAPPTAPSQTVSTVGRATDATVVLPSGSPQEFERVVIGQSVDGVDIVARRLSPAADVRVLGVGSIHGDEYAGIQVIDALAQKQVPAGIEMWVIDTVNPDGNSRGTRGNARGVDLNRNFDSGDWSAVGSDTDRYSGSGPGSEPEAAAVQQFLDELRPGLVVWWHQVGNHVDESPNIPDPEILQEFSDLSGLPRLVTSCGTPCVGNATTYVNLVLGGASFVVELPAQVDASFIDQQAEAFLGTAEYVARQ